MIETPPPGSIGLTRSRGMANARSVLGQALSGETTWYNHAVITLPEGMVMEPWPSGARVVPVEDYADSHVLYGWLPSLEPWQRRKITVAALSLDGIGYGLGDYAALAWLRNGPERRRSRRALARVARPDRLLPGQFVCEAYRRAGLPLGNGAALTLEDLGLMLLRGGWDLHCTYPPPRPRRRVALRR